MTKSLVLHIGSHKTGTTALQHFLHHNRDKLLKAGWLYPQAGISPRHFGHHNVAWKFLRGTDFDLDQLFAEIDASASSNVLLSSEEFEFIREPEQIREALKKYDTRVIIYLRRQDELLLSEFNQNVKMGHYGGNLTSFARRLERHGRFDYYELCGRWMNVFGKEKFTAHIFRPEIDVIATFTRSLRMDSVEYDRPRNLFENKSLDARLIGTLRSLIQLKQVFADKELFSELIQIAGKLLPATSLGTRHSLMDHAQRLEFLTKFRESNSKLSEEYLGGENFEAPEPIPDEIKVSDNLILPMAFKRIIERMATHHSSVA